MLIFEIHCDPKPQKQTMKGKNGFYDPSKANKTMLQWQIRPYAPKDPIEGPVEIDITFFLPIPKGTSKCIKKQMLDNDVKHVKRPDVDNLSYLVVNAMKGIVYSDDSQICDQHIHKRWADTGKIVVKILEL